MKKTFLIISVLFVICSCSKTDSNQIRELNITYKASNGINPDITNDEVYFYLNPFKDFIYVYISGATEGEIIISDDAGGMKKINFQSSNFELDFTGENPGAYYCEVYFNNKVFRTHLIKQ